MKEGSVREGTPCLVDFRSVFDLDGPDGADGDRLGRRAV